MQNPLSEQICWFLEGEEWMMFSGLERVCDCEEKMRA